MSDQETAQHNKQVADAAQRRMAVDVRDSYAVQAPAGSGKTELLSLRFLKLLTVVENPEEVLAITFTRKAASEMNNRILDTLEWAAHLPSSSEAVRAKELREPLAMDKYQVAQEVLQRDASLDWQLLRNTSRLRIQTIDSFSHYLAAQLPLHSRLGGTPQISEDTGPCYYEAVAATLAMLNSNDPVADDVEAVLAHFDNDYAKVESLLASLLRNRDQWLVHIFRMQNDPVAARDVLQDNLRDLVEESLHSLHLALTPHTQRLCDLAAYAAGNLAADGSLSAVVHCQNLDQLPAPVMDTLPVWQGLAELLLTNQTGSNAAWRRRVTVTLGFPPGTDKASKATTAARKTQFGNLVEDLAQQEGVLEGLDYVRLLPDGYSAEQWRMLTALTRLLPLLSAQLSVAFARQNVVDYSQIALAALEALGSEDDPTDLALVLDHQIHHILVDEFQDTSSLQIRLLERLTAGWQPDDGRTLFIVGDGMQSCYAFRNANVGLFIAAREKGIGNTFLEPLDLATNFRSSAGVVDWVNRVFHQAFPGTADITRGAVNYTAAAAFHPERAPTPITARLFTYQKDNKQAAWQAEAKAVVDHIQQLRAAHDKESIAILIRARSHLIHIVPALREASIPWQATEIDRLASLPVIEDLLSLTRALHNTHDRLAWLSVLRAPWAGFEAADLLVIARRAERQSIPHILVSDHEVSGLSDFAKQRLAELRPILGHALGHAARQPLHQVVNATWHLLRGPLLAKLSFEQKSIEHFFQLLCAGVAQQAQPDIEAFTRIIREQLVDTAASANLDEAVHILTIHKAKGLEFDHVILPGLSRKSRPDDKPLLIWHERINRAGEDRLLLATQGSVSDINDPLFKLLQYERQRRQHLEQTRLMYIAVTRAKHSALLLAALQDKEGQVTPPTSSSLLATIMEPLQSGVVDAPEIVVVTEASQSSLDSEPAVAMLRRWATPVTLTSRETASLAVVDVQTSKLEPTSLDAHARLQAEAGNLIHRVLQNHVQGKPVQNTAQLDAMTVHWRRQLQALADTGPVEATLVQIRDAIEKTLAAPDLMWIFQPEEPGPPLQDNASELSLQTLRDGHLQTYRIDRVVKDSQGQLWIIDYKSALPPSDMSQAEFIRQQQELYRDQLRGYRIQLAESLGTALSSNPVSTVAADHSVNTVHTNHNIRTALLFTALPLLVEVD